MKRAKTCKSRERRIAIRGGPWNGPFFPAWLEAASKADDVLGQKLEQAKTESSDWPVDLFDVAAMLFINELGVNLHSFMISTASQEAKIFYMMLQLGFFVSEEDHYQKTVPMSLDSQSVNAAVSILVDIDKRESMLNPGHLGASFSRAKARIICEELAHGN